MVGIRVPVNAKSMSIEAVIIRADGTREDLGTITYWHRNPFIRMAWKFRELIKRIIR